MPGFNKSSNSKILIFDSFLWAFFCFVILKVITKPVSCFDILYPNLDKYAGSLDDWSRVGDDLTISTDSKRTAAVLVLSVLIKYDFM